MRKITSEACYALQNKYAYKSSNTEVIINSNGSACMELHRNQIAMIDVLGDLYVRSAGWETSTTKERLNGLVGVHIIQKAGQWYLNGKKWEKSEEWTKVEASN